MISEATEIHTANHNFLSSFVLRIQYLNIPFLIQHIEMFFYS